MKLGAATKAKIERLTETWVVDLANTAFRGRVGTIVNNIDLALNNLMSGFFGDVVARLGSMDDLSDTGAAPWTPLSLKWIKRKGHANFYAYSSDPGFRRTRLPRGYGRPLLPTLKATSYEKAFGKPRVSILSTMSAGPKTRVNAHAREVIQDMRLEVSLYPAIGSGRFSHGNIENTLRGRGALSARNAQKLKGRPGRERPVLEPMMRFYSRVKLPQLLRDLARRSSRFSYAAPTSTVSVSPKVP